VRRGHVTSGPGDNHVARDINRPVLGNRPTGGAGQTAVGQQLDLADLHAVGRSAVPNVREEDLIVIVGLPVLDQNGSRNPRVARIGGRLIELVDRTLGNQSIGAIDAFIGAGETESHRIALDRVIGAGEIQGLDHHAGARRRHTEAGASVGRIHIAIEIHEGRFEAQVLGARDDIVDRVDRKLPRWPVVVVGDADERVSRIGDVEHLLGLGRPAGKQDRRQNPQ